MSFGCSESLGGERIASFGVSDMAVRVETEVVEAEVDGLDTAVEGLDEGGEGGANRLLILVPHAKTWCIPHGM